MAAIAAHGNYKRAGGHASQDRHDFLRYANRGPDRGDQARATDLPLMTEIAGGSTR